MIRQFLIEISPVGAEMKSSNQQSITSNYTKSLFGLFILFLASVSAAQNKVVVIPLGGDDVGQCVVSSDCDAGEATLTCPSGDIVIPCELPANNFKRVFVTSTTHTGDLGGLDSADAICQVLADNSMLDGRYKAWLSDAIQSPSTRFNRSDVPYELVDGTQVAANYDDLVDGTIQNTIDLTEGGGDFNTAVWTNTSVDGTPQFTGDGSCSGWQSSMPELLGLTGISVSIDSQWTALQALSCDTLRALYCFEQ